MGITGLLPLLKPVTKDIHVSELQGLTVGIDTYCWLHKGIYSCSAELCQGIPTDKFIKYCVERVRLLLNHGIRPYLVFDGGYLPAKAGKEVERRTKRETNLQRGKQLLREGNASAAHQFFSKAADVTPFMAHQLIQVVKRIPGVKCVVAPYEADAQLGFLARNGHVDAVITEDSDIILFGCTRVVFKLDRDGTGQEVDLREVFSRRNDELDMRGMNEDDLMTLCALSGCDYLSSVHGVGLKKAHRLVARHRELPKIMRAVKFEAAGGFPRGYEADFQRALFTFRHQRAFDPVSRTVVHMTPLPDILPDVFTTPLGNGRGSGEGDGGPLDFLGPAVAKERGCAVADGEVCPITGERFAEMTRKGAKEAPEAALSESAAAALAAWRGATMPAPGGGSKKSLSAQGNNLTKYWGTPLSKKSPSKRPESVVARGSVGRRDGCGTGADRSFELGVTPDRSPRIVGTAGSVRGGGAGGSKSGVLEEGGYRAKAHVPAKPCVPEPASPAPLPSCVSPGSFYEGISPGPPTPANASEDKENQESSNLDKGEAPEEADTEAAASTSKHFCAGAGPAGVGAVTPAPLSGLRRRFRPPLAAVGASTVGSLRRGEGGRACRGGGGAENNGRHDPDPWGADYAYPRLDAQASPGESAVPGGGCGGGGSGASGSRLKRRRTLGLGSIAPKGLIRSLGGVASGRGSGGLVGRRSTSLGGVPRVASSEEVRGEERDADGAAVGSGGGGGTDCCINNLFERFAARPLRPAEDVSPAAPSCTKRGAAGTHREGPKRPLLKKPLQPNGVNGVERGGGGGGDRPPVNGVVAGTTAMLLSPGGDEGGRGLAAAVQVHAKRTVEEAVDDEGNAGLCQEKKKPPLPDFGSIDNNVDEDDSTGGITSLVENSNNVISSAGGGGDNCRTLGSKERTRSSGEVHGGWGGGKKSTRTPQSKAGGGGGGGGGGVAVSGDVAGNSQQQDLFARFVYTA